MPERVIAVIPCLNEERYIRKLAQSLIATSTRLPMRIVIADGGSTDHTPQIAEEFARQNPNVLFINNPKRNQAAAINLAVRTCGNEAEYLIRIDAHANYPEDYCQKLVEEADATGADSVVVAMKTAGTVPFQKAVAAAQNSKLGNGGSAHRIIGQNGQWVDHGHHALMRVKSFRAVEGYDESFPYNEDAELDTRLRRAGYRIWLTGKTSLTYYPRSAPWPLFRQYMKHGSGRAQTILKHKAIPKLRQMLPAAVLPAAVLALLMPFCWIAALPLAVWALFCLAYGYRLGKASGDKDIYLAGPAAMIMHFGWSVGFWRSMFTELLRRTK